MTDHEKALIEETVRIYIETTDHKCRFDIDSGKHRAHHESMDNFISTMDRIANLKWGVLRGVVQALVIAGMLGLVVFMWQHGIKNQ